MNLNGCSDRNKHSFTHVIQLNNPQAAILTCLDSSAPTFLLLTHTQPHTPPHSPDPGMPPDRVVSQVHHGPLPGSGTVARFHRPAQGEPAHLSPSVLASLYRSLSVAKRSSYTLRRLPPHPATCPRSTNWVLAEPCCGPSSEQLDPLTPSCRYCHGCLSTVYMYSTLARTVILAS